MVPWLHLLVALDPEALVQVLMDIRRLANDFDLELSGPPVSYACIFVIFVEFCTPT